MKTPHDPDAELYFEFINNGDRSALEALVDQWHGPAYRLARCICRNSSLAEEAVQDAFVALVSSKTRYQPRRQGTFRAWFLGLVTNRARMSRRSERRADAKKTVNPSDYAKRKGITAKLKPVVVAKELREGLEHCLDAIEERWRTPVVLHVVEGIHQREVASMLGITQQSVSKRIERGLELLRVRMAQAGFSVSVVALSDALSAGQVFSAPAGMAAKLTKSCSSAPAAGAAHSSRAIARSRVTRSMRAKATTSQPWWPVVVAGSAMVIGLAIGLGMDDTVARPEASPRTTVEPEPPPPRKAVPKQPKEKPMGQWSLDKGKPDDFEVVIGTWKWKPPTGDMPAVMWAGAKEKLGILLKPRVPSKPFVVDIKTHTTPEPGSINVGAFWSDGRHSLSRRFWHEGVKFDAEGKPVHIKMYFVGAYCTEYIHGKLFSVRKAARPYPADRIFFWLVNVTASEVKVRELRPDEITPDLRDPRDLASRLKNAPTLIPKQRFRNFRLR